MRGFALAVVFLAASPDVGLAQMACSASGNATHCIAMDNLAQGQDRGCITLERAEAKMSPADLALSVVACAHEDRATDAAELFLLMLARGRFDTGRVRDRTAHQAMNELLMDIPEALAPDEAAALDARLQAAMANGSDADFTKICARIASLGVPAHDPSYMIAHGLSGEGGDGLVPDFDAKLAWQDVLHSFLKCPD